MSGTKKHRTVHSAKKKAAAVVAAILLLLIAFGSTYAWKDYKQHKTNEFANSEPKYEAVLAEDFQEKENWRVSDGEVKKTISVTNTGIAENGFEAVYVRIQLKEYMEIVPMEWEETADRYMVDTGGKYIVFETEAQARASYPDAPFDELKGGAYKILTDAVSGVTGWFIPTKEYDENGQYGKYVVTKYELGGKVTKVTGDDIDRADDDAQKNRKHDVVANGVDTVRNGECDYRKYIWDSTQINSGGLFTNTADNPTMEYIKWILGENVITLSEWINLYDGAPVSMWIIDDTEDNNDQWIYWGEALLPGEQTSDFLRAVELIKQPGGDFYYAVHTEMQAVSIDELRGGDLDWPEDIVESYTRMRVDSVTVYNSNEEIIANGSAIFIPKSDTAQEHAFTAVVEGENLKKGTVTWTIEDITGEGITIDKAGKLKIPPGYKGRITVRATSDDDTKVYSEFTVIIGEADDFSLTAKQGDGNNIELTWDDSSLPENDDGYGYIIYQSSDDGETWETRGANYGKPVKVLNVYPNVGDQLKAWMEGPAGRGVISVDKVTLPTFNVNPNTYLKDAQGNYRYDVVMFGSWDGNNGLDISVAGVSATEAFLSSGRGVLFGHDTFANLYSFNHPNFNKLAKYVNISLPVSKHSNLSTPAGAINCLGSYKVQVINDGFLLQYPWPIAMNSILTIPFSHALGEIANGTVWMKYAKVNGLYGVQNDSGTRALWGVGPDESYQNKGTNNHYLTTYNNAAMIQTGHSNGAATVDEQHVIANTLMYLAQFTNAIGADDFSGRDMAPPNIPAAAYTGENTVSISSFDNGTKYLYYVKAVDQTDPAKVYISNIVTQTSTTGLKGFYISEDTSPNGSPAILRSQSTGEIITEPTLLAADNEVVTYTVQNNNKYIHIIAVDYAGNLSPVRTIGEYTPPEVTGFTVSVSGDVAQSAKGENFTLNLNQDESARAIILTGNVAGTNLTNFPNGFTSWTKSGTQSAWGAANGNGTTYEINVPANVVGTIIVTAKAKDDTSKTITVTINVTFEGSGTDEDPWLIKTPVDLAQLAAVVNNNTPLFANAGRYYKQENSFSLSGYSNWTPIGNNTNQFKGNYDGDSKSIAGLVINNTAANYMGLFGRTASGSSVKNLNLQNVNIKGSRPVGGMSGHNDGTIKNCGVSGTVSGASEVGGLVGTNGGTTANCYSTCTVSGTGTSTTGGDSNFGNNIGGLVGYNPGTLTTSYATGNVSGKASCTGGVVGCNYGSMSNCYATGNVSSTNSSTGGVVGWGGISGYPAGTMTNCYATGTVSGPDCVGGVVGGFNLSSSYAKNCVALNASVNRTSGSSANFGRVIGYVPSGTFSGNYALSTMSCTVVGTKGTGTKDGADVTAATAKTVSFWQTNMSWNTTSVWDVAAGRLPILRNVGGTQTG